MNAQNTNSQNSQTPRAHTDHRRQWRELGFVYPVVSRRAGGLSIGVNLNTDKLCNYSCIYCQIDRRTERISPGELSMDALRQELESVIDEALTGQLWQEERFKDVPENLRRINDIAFSGDGEPTSLPIFPQAVQAASQALANKNLTGQVKIIIITNATCLQSDQFTEALDTLNQNASEIWAKLDAGTEDYYQQINIPAGDITLDEICENILAVATDRPVILQTLFMNIDGEPPCDDELQAYCDRVNVLVEFGAQIPTIQLHTIARPPASSHARALSNDQLDKIEAFLKERITSVEIKKYYGVDVPSIAEVNPNPGKS